MSAFVKCNVCLEECKPKATHTMKADDDRFGIEIKVTPAIAGNLDTCPTCWWKLVRTAIRQSMKEPV